MFLRLKPLTVLIAAIACLFAPGVLRAQAGAIAGTVTDSSGAPLVGASVALAGTVQGCASAIDGSFMIRNVVPGSHTLVVTMIGFERAERHLVVPRADTTRISIRLTETPIRTDEVVVTAGRRAQSLEEVPVSVAVFDGKQVDRRALTSLDQALRYIPGVNMTESQVNIRGSSGYSRALGSRVLLLLDGVPLLAGDANEIKYDDVPMFMIDRIEVVKGAGSALYGSSALGGVINVMTKVPVRKFTRARLSSGAWTNPRWREWKWWSNGVRTFNGVDVQHGDVSGDLWWLAGAGAHTDRGYRLTDDYVRWNANAKAGIRTGSESNLTVALNYASADHGNWIYWRDLAHALVPPQSADLTERLISTKLQASALFRSTVSPTFTWLGRGYVYRTAYDMRSDTTDYATHPTDKTQSTAVVYGGQWQGTILHFARNVLVTGVDGAFTTVRSSTYHNRSGVSGAVYVQNDYQMTDAVSLSAGGRYDVTKIDSLHPDGQINPRVGMTWSPLHGSIVRGSYGWGFRAPSVAERFASASGNGIRTKPNPGLLAERSVSYELGMRQELPLPAILDVAVFQNDYTNLVEPTIDPADGYVYFSNITRARIQGVETQVQASLFNAMVQGSVSYTYMWPRDMTLGTILKYRPRHLFYASGELHVLDGFLGIDFRFVGRIDQIDRELSLLIRDADQRVDTKVTDIRVGWNFARLGIPVTATLTVNNVFNYSYAEIVGNIAPIRNVMLSIESSL